MGIPTVIATPYPLQAAAAERFSRLFYTYLRSRPDDPAAAFRRTAREDPQVAGNFRYYGV
jgi:hypothetical protein